MSNTKPILPLWPFIAVDVLFFGLAFVLLKFGHRPLPWQESGLLVLCGILGAASLLTPILRRTSDEKVSSQTELLAEVAGQLQKLEHLAAHISGATNQWLELQTHTAQAAESAKQVVTRMEVEAKAFKEFMERAHDAERTQLRVEVEKLRRAEGDRLQVVVHVLDHVFALFQAARHSGKPGLVEQIGQFQKACHDAARRIGLVQTMAKEEDVFNAALHQVQANITPTPDALVADTLVAGYTYQGQLLRRPVVALKTIEKGSPA